MNLIKNYWLNVLFILIGIVLMAIGGTLFLEAKLGGDALLVMNQGLGVFLKIETGTAMIISNIIMFLIVLIIFRKSIGLGTVLVSVLLGLVINFIASLNLITTSDKTFINYLYVFLGIFIGGFGIALYIYANLGLSPSEGLIIYFMELTNKRFFIIKIINDAIFFTIGFLLGGTVGIGSVITVFLFGPVIDLYLVFLKKTNLIKEKVSAKN